MLAGEALQFATERIRLELRDRVPVLARELAQMREAGHGSGSRTVIQGRQIIQQEYEIRYQIAWQIFARLIQASSASPTIELGTQVKREIGMLVQDGSTDIRDADAKLLTVGGNWPDHQSLWSPASDRIASEIDITLLAARQAPQTSAGSSVNIFNPIGVVQTGPASSAVLTQHIDASAKEAIVAALQQLRVEIANSVELNPTAQAEIVAVVADAETEARAPKPNITRLRGALTGIATSIQTLGSAGEAYRVLRGAAALIGIQLP